MRTIVADSSVFIHLAPIGRVPLLRSLFGNLLVPPAVWQEVVTQGKDRPGAAELRTAVEEGWISIVFPQPEHVPGTSTVLHRGEAEAIGLAKGLSNCLLILDEAFARGVAKGLGIKVIGIVGVLVLAKRNGLVTKLADELKNLRVKGGFRISTQLYQEALSLVGEHEEH